MPKRKPPTFDDIEAQLIKLGYIRDRANPIDPDFPDLGSINLDIQKLLNDIDSSTIPQLIADLDLTLADQAASNYIDAIGFSEYLEGLEENFPPQKNLD
jgi:hypothetical protein